MAPGGPTEYLEVPDGRLAYELAGPAAGDAIVLLHEGIADRRMWDREFPELARHHRTVRYDLRGYGDSPPATAAFSPVEDLKILIDRLHLERPVLVGASVGGKIALDFALVHPGVVRGLFLVAPGFSGMDYPMFPDGIFEADERASQAAVAAYRAGKIEEAIEHLRGLWGAALTGAELERFRSMVRANAPEVFLDRSASHERGIEPQAATRLARLDVPLRVLVGDRDNPAQPAIARHLAEKVPGARLTVVPGADHLLNLTAPAAFDSALAEFLEERAEPLTQETRG